MLATKQRQAALSLDTFYVESESRRLGVRLSARQGCGSKAKMYLISHYLPSSATVRIQLAKDSAALVITIRAYSIYMA